MSQRDTSLGDPGVVNRGIVDSDPRSYRAINHVIAIDRADNGYGYRLSWLSEQLILAVSTAYMAIGTGYIGYRYSL